MKRVSADVNLYEVPASRTGAVRALQVQHELDELFRLNDEDASELLLVRHAEPAPPAEDRDSQPADPFLSCTGLEQAELLAARLDSLWLQGVYTAPERRAFQTAKVVADTLQRPLHIMEELADIDLDASTVAEHRSGESITERFIRLPRWESIDGPEVCREFRRRSILAIERILAANPARRIAVITHASVINAYLSMVLAIPRDVFFTPDYASISVVRQSGDLYAVRGLNDTQHLAGTEAAWPSSGRALTLRSLPLTNR
jgi:2,3-bisphosphoglycerate-dependent phosphoglycerate mutase